MDKPGYPSPRSCHGSGHGSCPGRGPPLWIDQLGHPPPPHQKWSWKLSRKRTPFLMDQLAYPTGWTSQGTPPGWIRQGPPRTEHTSAIHQLTSGRYSFGKRISTCYFLRITSNLFITVLFMIHFDILTYLLLYTSTLFTDLRLDLQYFHSIAYYIEILYILLQLCSIRSF